MTDIRPERTVLDRRRHNRNRASLVACLCALLPAGCSVVPLPPDTTDDACSAITPLFAADVAIDDATHPCHDWIDKTHGRIARSFNASAVVWSRRTEFGTALLVSAMHAVGAGVFGPSGERLEAGLLDPKLETGVARLALIDATGRDTDDLLSPTFTLYHPAVPADEYVGSLENILPEHDFYVAVLDGQKIASDGTASPEPLTDTPTPLYDPGQFTTTAPTYADADTNALVLAMGFPRSGATAGLLSASVGRVLSNAEAESAIAELAIAGDVEGDIPYEPAVEIIIDGFAMGGMSGGGVFDFDGRLVGIIVRASDPRDGVQYVRAVRMSYIAGGLDEAVESATVDLQEAVAPYIEPPNTETKITCDADAAIQSEFAH